ncbi:hypothetical protein ARMGADRAFT_1037011 [Armillaria gallica]|uniref:Uncharacterized protein n=1 Tax=Armillaria gallica TaxID=47427 RepID=A0A2H3CN59_ARMGA|nr:hypothetical protein ARMGADRAFT_1037011 [Armillaria gallica]
MDLLVLVEEGMGLMWAMEGYSNIDNTGFIIVLCLGKLVLMLGPKSYMEYTSFNIDWNSKNDLSGLLNGVWIFIEMVGIGGIGMVVGVLLIILIASVRLPILGMS